MSDLRGGPTSSATARAQNGGSRAAPGSVPARVVTPTEIMRRRRQKEEQKEQEERDNQRAERTAPGVAVREGKLEETSANRRPKGRLAEDASSQQKFDAAKRVNKPNAGPTITTNLRQPAQSGNTRLQEQQNVNRATANGSSLPQPTRPRAASSSQPQTRTAQPQHSRAASATYTTQQQPSQTRPTSQAAVTNQAQGPSATPSFQRAQNTQAGTNQSKSANSSSFPHAFERWETLSSHWEGLTSFWIKRLEGNSAELNGQPLNQQLARQVTDLSAAGANLFHAVVELQRLRASSERKFQRWFFETRSEQEKTQERMAQLEAELREEKKKARAEETTSGVQLEAEKASVEEMNRVTRRADQRINEMKRELQISREEARRGWEEIGRMEQAERDRTFSLKRGEPTIVGGVQVVPMPQAGTSRQTSTSRGYGGGLSSHPVQPGEGVEGEAGYTAYDGARSDTDTDPFTDRGRDMVPEVPKIPTSMQTQQSSATSLAALQAAQTATARNPAASQSTETQAPSSAGYRQDYSSQTTSDPTSFYQHHGSGTSLHGGDGRQALPLRTTDTDERSYVQSVDDPLSEEEDYELDNQGQVRRDASGNPILLGSHHGHQRGGPGSEDGDDYNVLDQLQRDHILAQRYGSGGNAGPGVSNGQIHTSSPPSSQLQQPDYSGAGYGAGSGWEAVVPRHHHPTRLSDVLEEDERSRTSPSRASERSRVLH